MLLSLLFCFLGLARAQDTALPTSAFVSMGWRGYAMAGHISHGPAFAAGASLLHDRLRVGIAGTSRPGPINPATFPLTLDTPYKGQSTLSLRSDGGTTGLLVEAGLPLAQGRLRLSVPLMVGYGGYGFYLVDEDRQTPDGRKPSAWENELMAGTDSAFGVVVDTGLQLAFVAERTVHPTVSARYHSVLGYDAAYADRYAGPTVELGVEVVPRRAGRVPFTPTASRR
jgi:hypothetical protein